MTEHILKHIDTKESENFLSALHALSVLSPQALKEFCFIVENAKRESERKGESGIFHRMKKRMSVIKFDFASYIYF